MIPIPSILELLANPVSLVSAQSWVKDPRGTLRDERIELWRQGYLDRMVPPPYSERR